MPREFVALDGYEIFVTTDRAIGIAKAGEYISGGEVIWIPKSQCAFDYPKGETDIEVAKWLADQEGLDY